MTSTLITNATILDCTGAKPRPDQALLVEDGRIAKLGAREAVAAFAAGHGPHATIDAAGMTVMPGLIDAHVHVSYGDILSVEELDLYAGVEFRSIRAAHNVKKVLRAGVTFRYTESGPEGLLKGKKAVLIQSRGGLYSEGPAAAMDGKEGHIRTLLGFAGIVDVTVVHAEKLASGPEAATP